MVKKRKNIKNQDFSTLGLSSLKNGPFDIGRVMELKVNQLRFLARELSLKIPKKAKKQALQSILISKLRLKHNNASSLPNMLGVQQNHHSKTQKSDVGFKISIKKDVVGDSA